MRFLRQVVSVSQSAKPTWEAPWSLGAVMFLEYLLSPLPLLLEEDDADPHAAALVEKAHLAPPSRARIAAGQPEQREADAIADEAALTNIPWSG